MATTVHTTATALGTNVVTSPPGGTAQSKCKICGLLVEADGGNFRTSQAGPRESGGYAKRSGTATAVSVDQCPALADGQTHRPA